MFSFILWLVIIGCLVVFGFIVARHWHQLLASDQSFSGLSQQTEVKKRILEQRLERHLIVQGNKIIIFIKPFLHFTASSAKKFFKFIVLAEQKYKAKLLKQNFSKKIDQQQFLHQKLKEALKLQTEKKYSDAEKKYIDILTVDDRNVSAYWGLGKLYAEQEDYDQAQETLKYLLKLQPGHNQARKLLAQVAGQRGDLILAKKCLELLILSEPKDISCYLSLAAAEMGLESPINAQVTLQKGLLIEPNNTRLLDFLIEVSIFIGDIETAVETLKTLQFVNPENAKIEEYRKKINEV